MACPGVANFLFGPVESAGVADPDYLRFFPYGSPYAQQAEAMGHIASSLRAGRPVLFEGACGTGKTLAALAPALQVARETDRTVVITTNVHQQMRQFVAEARAITEREPIRAVVFRGKSSMCHLDVGYEECQVLRENTRELVELEADRDQLARRQRELLERMRDDDPGAAQARKAVMEELDAVEADLEATADRATCAHYHENLAGDHGFEAWLFDDVRTPDEVYAYADERTLCGYELLKEAMGAVDLVVCNYHHLLNPGIRTQFFRWLGRDPDEVIAVFDEAHNLERTARDHATRTLAERTLEASLDELAGVDDPAAESARALIDAFRRALVATYEEHVGTPGRIGPEWTDVTVANEDRRDDLTLAFLDRYSGPGIAVDLRDALELGRDLDRQYEEAYRRGEASTRRESGTLRAAAFIEAYLEDGDAPGQYPVVSVRRDESTGDLAGRAELYACLPREITQPLFDDLHASVLMSATLRPFDVTAEVLGIEGPETLAYGLGFPPEHRRTFAVDVPPLFASAREDPAVQRAVTTALEDAIRYSPGNVLAYFPSYAEAARYEGLVDLEVACYLDEPGRRVEPLREAFVAGEDGALFTSLWGTLTEGVSFDGNDAHTVVVVGVPYPRLDDRTRAVQSAYADAFGDRAADAGWSYAIEIPTIRKTRQALGRVLRSPDEIGVRVLLDRRYTEADMGKYSVRGTFPPEERAELVDVEPGKLKYAMLNFFADHDAWDGARPAV